MLTSLKNILTKKNLALMILFILALIVRIIYITQTDYNERSYDIGSIIQLNGHCGYIKFLSEGNFKLPYFNPSERWQYYHTPLHHFISALWIKIVFYFQNYQIAFESLQYLITFYSMLIIFFSYKILKSLNFGFFAIFISLIFIAFHPSMLLFSGILNNDLLCLLLCTISIWRMIEWNKQPTIKNTLILTIFCGLAAMSKFSAIILLPPICITVLYKFIKSKAIRFDLIKQTLIFLSLYIPLGYWYEIRNYIKFKLPIFYINPTGFKKHISENFIQDRFFNLSPESLTTPFLQYGYYHEYNILIYLLKSATFGEFSLAHNTPIAFQLFLMSIAITIFLIFCIAHAFIKNKENLSLETKIFLGALLITIFAAFMKHNISYPVFCTQDFRFILTTLIIALIGLASTTQSLQKSIFKYFIASFIILFSIFSVIFYTTCLY